ncbi:hypothetical protein CAEBREN_09555 [Caenorhabditis brenneri]|uniref:Uncharacterized protein n=1 Tax=Caenorhabditis brenneri TaxID=135651 RepID=G0PIZ9_CAEBE|nr:hypothetical protein CAEBREN_09555 [Caenorhabditis brenneri]
MSEKDDNQETEKNEEEDKENFDDSRANSPMTNSTVLTSGRVHNEKAEVAESGDLDLSNLSLTNIERTFSKEYEKVKRLIISGNSIQHFTYMNLFRKCEILVARDCEIKKFISDFNNHLIELYLAGNKLKEINHLGRFENLKVLDLSSNIIEHPVNLSLKSLEILNLSENNLNELPDLCKCVSLHSLNLSRNTISDISAISSCISPSTLQTLDISSNSIDDLSQFSTLSFYRKLKEVAVAHNPCITGVTNEEKLDYRPYIVACCSEELSMIDGEEIEETVQTEGEWLAMQGKIKKIGPGNHDALCELLTRHFPKTDSGPPTPAQKTCHKALQKKRSIALERVDQEDEMSKSSVARSDDTDRTVNSVYSPFREWNGKMGGLETPGSSGSGRSHPKKNNLIMCSPPEARKNRSFTFQAESSADKLLQHQSVHLQKAEFASSTETVICSSSRTELSFMVDGRNESTPLPIVDSTPTKEIARTSPSATNRLTPSVADISYISDETEDLKTHVKYLEQKVNELSKQNENLTAINDGLVGALETLKAEQTHMWKAIRNLIPKPQNMTSNFVAETEDGHHVYQLKWDMPLVKGYQIFVDGNPCGEIIGKHNSARITDLSANQSHFVQIQPIGINGEYGELSKKLHINPTH